MEMFLEMDTEEWLRTKPYGKGDGFNFPIVNFPFICSNIPTAPPYAVYNFSVDTVFQNLWLL